MVLIAGIVVGIAKSVMAEFGFAPDTLGVSLLFTPDRRRVVWHWCVRGDLSSGGAVDGGAGAPEDGCSAGGEWRVWQSWCRLCGVDHGVFD